MYNVAFLCWPCCLPTHYPNHSAEHTQAMRDAEVFSCATEQIKVWHTKEVEAKQAEVESAAQRVAEVTKMAEVSVRMHC